MIPWAITLTQGHINTLNVKVTVDFYGIVSFMPYFILYFQLIAQYMIQMFLMIS